MNSSAESLTLDSEELAIVSELLASDRARLLVEIRHTDHRVFREELRRRLTVLERLVERLADHERALADAREGTRSAGV